jgi:hypothetical protein
MAWPPCASAWARASPSWSKTCAASALRGAAVRRR